MLNLDEDEGEWAMLRLFRLLVEIPPVDEGPVSTTAHALAESYELFRKLDAENQRKKLG